MVFPSIPAYLDPSNWQQQQQPQPNHHHHHHHQHLHQQQQEHGHGVGEGVSSQLLPRAPPPPPPPLPPQPHGSSGAGVGSIRPGSMADRARMANIPMPETQLKCPRCESSNTKFCYFNNYSLTQPRHFCKTCRRYWTRGGALRSVPVGGGCRRNKRSKGSGGGGSSNKSPATSSDRQTASGASSSTLSSNSGPTTSDMLLGLGPQIPPLRFMAPLHHFNEFASSDHLGLNYPGLSCGPIGGPGSDLSFQIGTALAGLGGGGGGGSSIFGGGGLDQWRNIQQGGGGGHQFPFLGGLDSTSSGLYPFEGGAEPSSYGIGGAGHHNLVRPKMLITTSSIATQLASVKMEESNQERMNLSRQLLGIAANNLATGNESSTPQYWSGPAWSTDLSSFSSSSTSNQM